MIPLVELGSGKIDLRDLFTSSPTVDKGQFTFAANRQTWDGVRGFMPPFQGDVVQAVREGFPGLVQANYVDERLDDGEYIPASFQEGNWTGNFSDTFLIADHEAARLTHDEVAIGAGWQVDFTISDSGLPVIYKGGLLTPRSDKDGYLHFKAKYQIEKKTGKKFYPRRWMGYISVNGENPGPLVTAVRDQINKTLERRHVPIWREGPSKILLFK